MQGHRVTQIPSQNFSLVSWTRVRVLLGHRFSSFAWMCLPWVFLAVLPAYAQQPPMLPGEGVVATTVFRGQELTYTVTDGLAIHGGDIILGTAEEAAAAAPLAAAAELQPATHQGTEHEDEGLWPGGVIPYVIDHDVSNAQDVLRAIEEWNSKTVISLVERTTEEDYVRFRSVAGGCRAHQGRIGGEQFIQLHESCDWRIVVHEIGHAVGLWHEHQRQDRDRYLMVNEYEVGLCSNPFDLRPEAVVDRPYDYASTMHYGRGPFADLPWLDTIPPGISIVSAFTPAPLSSGDIDYVARLYGQEPTATTISTNPPGLDIVVDGVRYTSPATFDWVPGSEHQIEAPTCRLGTIRSWANVAITSNTNTQRLPVRLRKNAPVMCSEAGRTRVLVRIPSRQVQKQPGTRPTTSFSLTWRTEPLAPTITWRPETLARGRVVGASRFGPKVRTVSIPLGRQWRFLRSRARDSTSGSGGGPGCPGATA